MSNAFLPVGRATASDLRDIKEPGLLLPVRKMDVPLIITIVGGSTHGIVLSGTHAFIHFAVELRTPHRGLFIPQVEIVVDFKSATDGSPLSETHGTLILAQNELSVVATKAGNEGWGPQPIPLWGDVDGGSDNGSVAFTRWGLGVRDNGRMNMLWQNAEPEE